MTVPLYEAIEITTINLSQRFLPRCKDDRVYEIASEYPNQLVIRYEVLVFVMVSIVQTIYPILAIARYL